MGRLGSYAAFALGFWVLYQGISRPNLALAILGGAILLGAMYLMVAARRSDPAQPAASPMGREEDKPGDTSQGSGPRSQLPP